MATAVTNYYCYKCDKYIPHLIEAQCPECHDAFVEEASAARFDSPRSFPFQSTSRRNPFEGRRGTTIANGSIFLHGAVDDDEDDDDAENNDSTHRGASSPMDPFLQHLLTHTLHQIHHQQNRAPYPAGQQDRTRPIDVNEFFLQFFNQMRINEEPEGVAPASPHQIQSIPNVQIRPEQTREHLQCSICMDEFEENERVKRLTCSHHFHEKCISTWLRQHGTCPTCRVNIHQQPTQRNSSSRRSDRHPFGSFRSD